MFDILGQIIEGAYEGDRAMPNIATVPQIVSLAINIIVTIAFGASFIFLALSFIKLSTVHSGGDPKKVEEGFKGVLYAIIGIILSITVYSLKTILLNIFGLSEPTS